MPDLFWKRRIRKNVKAFLRSQPAIPAPLDENMFLVEAAQAAIADRNSNAYDEFMFSEDGYEKTPYEDAIDEIVDLHKTHIPQRQSSSVLETSLELDYRKSKVTAAEKAVNDAEIELQRVTDLIQEEDKVLSGEKFGDSGSKWRGQAPDTTSRSRHVSRRLIEWSIFLLVAAVDAVVVYFSLKAIVGVREAIWFSIPVIGVQILFPHLSGSAIRNFAKSKPETGWGKWYLPLKQFDLYLALLVFLAWLGYVWAMMILRFNVMKALIQNTPTVLTEELKLAIQILSLFLLIGYGLWILIRAIRHNPHETKSSRLQFIQKSKTSKLNRKLRNLAKTVAAVESVAQRLDRLIAENWSIEEQKHEHLRETAKSVYRRSLANAYGDPEFTTKYLPKSKFQFKKNRAEN